MRAVLMVALLLAAGALAGCSGTGRAGPATGAPAPAHDEGAMPGTLRGVVVDAAVRPVAGVRVTTQARQGLLAANTTAAGAFRFDRLDPGVYFLRTHKAGFEDSQTRVEVVDNKTLVPPVRIQVVAITQFPAVDVLHVRGFLECSFVVGTAQTGGHFFPCEDPVTGTPVGNDASRIEIPINPNVTWIQTTLSWQASQQTSQQLGFNLYYSQAEYPTSIMGTAHGPSPLVLDLNGTDADRFGDAGHAFLEVLASRDAVQGVAGAAIQQDFEVVLVVFHAFTPPPGYLFWKDGEPTVPPA